MQSIFYFFLPEIGQRGRLQVSKSDKKAYNWNAIKNI